MWRKFANWFYTNTTAVTLALIGGAGLLTYNKWGYVITQLAWSFLVIMLITNPSFWHDEAIPKAKEEHKKWQSEQRIKKQK